MFKISDKASHTNQRGFSLVEILVGVAMLGGLSIAVINMTKQQAKLSTQSQIDGDVSEASARILNALNSPKYCDTNFAGKPLSGTLPTGGALTVIGGDIKVQPTTADWSTAASAGNITNRLRMNSATWNVNASTVAANTLAILTLNVQFESNALESKRKTISKIFTATVIVDTGATIIGCPKSWNSTVKYMP